MKQEQIAKIADFLESEIDESTSFLIVLMDESEDKSMLAAKGKYDKIAESIFYTIMKKDKLGKNLFKILKDVLANIADNDKDMRLELINWFDQLKNFNEVDSNYLN